MLRVSRQSRAPCGALLFVLVLAIGLGRAWAQPVSDSLTVTATNVGRFNFTIASAAFDFGNVNADGVTSSTGILGGRNGSNTGAIYTANAATTWSCTSSPTRLVRIFNASTTATIGWGTADRLSMRIPATGLPPPATSCGFKTFTTVGDAGSTSCVSGNLLRSMTVGTGAMARSGNLDFQLDVLDTDVMGTNTWMVVLTANAL